MHYFEIHSGNSEIQYRCSAGCGSSSWTVRASIDQVFSCSALFSDYFSVPTKAKTKLTLLLQTASGEAHNWKWSFITLVVTIAELLKVEYNSLNV